MKKFIFKIFFVFLFFQNTQAQEYNVMLIPESLKQHANVVERFEETKIIIKDIDKAEIKHKYAYTILNDAGNKYAEYFNDYSDIKDLYDIDGTLYDFMGKKIKSVKKKDIGDYSGDGEQTLASDARFKVHNFYYTQYPYTVEYEDEEEYKGIFYLPFWFSPHYENFSVQQSRLIVETPVDYNLRYKEINYPGQPVITKANDKITYVWEVNNQPAINLEPYSPGLNEIATGVLLAPSKFSIQGFTGNMDSWQNFGMFPQALLGGRDELDDITKQKVLELTDTIQDEKAKVFALYKYMQQNTRYINVSFGIGGWQPHDAKYVAQNKYGDCKALSNFMGALLKEAGINSYYTVIKAGAYNTHFYPDFPSNQFNHVIRCVPLQKDTVWLECTNQTMPAGYLGDFTCNRPALLITDNGGKLVHTPFYSENDNIYSRKINASLSAGGDLSATIYTYFKGLEFDDQHTIVQQLKKDEIIKYFNNAFPLANYEVTGFSSKENDAEIPSIDEKIELNAVGYAHVSGKRLFIIPDILDRSPYKLDSTEKRLYPIVYPYAFKHTDTFEITLPEGYSVESMPKSKTLKNEFGNYAVTCAIINNKIIYTRLYIRVSGRFPADKYNDFVRFYNDMYKTDREQIVLVKNNS